jgi:hypothetical protein
MYKDIGAIQQLVFEAYKAKAQPKSAAALAAEPRKGLQIALNLAQFNKG